MKVKALANMINDYGTKPRVKIMKHGKDCSVLVYEGKPENIDEETNGLKVNSFTVLGTGYIEIHAQ